MKRVQAGFSIGCVIFGLLLIVGLSACSGGNDEPTNGDTAQPYAGAAPWGQGGSYTPPATGGYVAPPTGGSTPPPVTGGTGGSTPPPVTGGGGGEIVTTGGTGGTPPPAAGTGGTPPAGGTGGTPPAGGTGGTVVTDPACQSSLTEGCMQDNYQAREKCASFGTFDEPNIIIQGGPYGSYGHYNVGQAFALPVNLAEAACAVFGATFGEDPILTADLMNLRDVDLTLYLVNGPACPVQGETYPVITWGNGTCAQPAGYAPLLGHLASHGYIVVAAHSRYVGGNNGMIVALDFLESYNNDPENPWYQMADFTKVGAMGHSQGGGATVAAAADPRIKSVIIWNAGTAPAVKPSLVISGVTDIGDPGAAAFASAINGAGVPAAYVYYNDVPQTGNMSGHLTNMLQPERCTEINLGWWDFQLKGIAAARDMFVGPSCGLCTGTNYGQGSIEYGANGLLQ